MAENGTQAKKFQTRTGISRKTKEDREQYARDEAVRQQQRLAETVQTPLNAPEKGGTAGRGRLTAFSSASNRVRSENTGGVFGAAVSPLPKSRIDRNANAVSTASEEVNEPKQQEGSTVAPSDVDSSTKTKSTVPQDEASAKAEKKSSTRPRGTTSKAKDLVYVSSEDDVDEDARRDIEQIWISSDEDITLSRTNGKRKESSRGQHKPTLRPLRAPRDSRDEGEALSARNRVLSTVEKHEAGPDGQDVNRGTAVKDDNVVETSDKLLRSTGNVDKKSSKRKGGRLKDTIAVTETAEEYAERLRYNEDVRKLLGEIKHYQSPNQSGPAQTRSVDDFKDRRLYLLQFPPMTPMLLDPAEEVEVKQEPENETVPGAAATEKASGMVVKKEDRAEERPRKSDVLTADNMQLPSGLVGALRVHRSGKVTMDWGGADMEVRYGTEVDFLQDVVMTDAATETAWALGHVEKKMVCIPNWQKLYE